MAGSWMEAGADTRSQDLEPHLLSHKAHSPLRAGHAPERRASCKGAELFSRGGAPSPGAGPPAPPFCPALRLAGPAGHCGPGLRRPRSPPPLPPPPRHVGVPREAPAHGVRAGAAQAVHHRGGRHRRLPRHRGVQASGCHHQPVADPGCSADARLPRAGAGGHGLRQGAGRAPRGPDQKRHGQAFCVVWSRDTEKDSGPCVHRSGREALLRQGRNGGPSQAPHPALRGGRRQQGQDSDKAVVHLGRNPGRKGAGAAARRPLQHDAALLLRPGCGLRRGGRDTHLPLCGAHPGLARGQHGEEGLRAPRGPWGEERHQDLQLLQEVRLQDHRHGRLLPQHGRDQGAGRLRLPHHLAQAAGGAAERQCQAGARALGQGGPGQRPGAGAPGRGGLPLAAQRGPDGRGEALRRDPQVRRRRREAGAHAHGAHVQLRERLRERQVRPRLDPSRALQDGPDAWPDESFCSNRSGDGHRFLILCKFCLTH